MAGLMAGYMPTLIIITLAAYATEFAFFGSSLDQGIDEDPDVIDILSSLGVFFQFLTFTVPGIPPIMSILFFFLIILPWLLVIGELIIEIIPL